MVRERKPYVHIDGVVTGRSAARAASRGMTIDPREWRVWCSDCGLVDTVPDEYEAQRVADAHKCRPRRGRP